MRIAVWHNLPSGGGKRALFDQVGGLRERGHHVEVWCPPTADQTFLSLAQLADEHVVGLDEPHVGPGVRALNVATAGHYAELAQLQQLRGHTRRCAAEIDRGGFDVVFANSSSPFAVPPIARDLATPSLLYLQEPDRRHYESTPSWFMRAPAPLRRPLSLEGARRARSMFAAEVHRVLVREERDSASAFDRLLVNSIFSRENVTRAYGLDARVCYLGVDLSRYRELGLDRDRGLVVGIGQFSSHKRVELALEIIGAMRPPRPRLAWVGNVADRRYLDGLVAEAGARGVGFEPHVGISHDAVVELLNRAGCLLYAPRLEPFGYAPIEAAACGLPVVAMAEGGVRESVVDGVTGFLALDPGSAARSLERVLGDASLREAMGRAARAHAEAVWSLDDAVDRIESHLREVAAA